MILSFSDFIAGEESLFEMKIGMREKIHTFRLGERFKVGYGIQHWMGNPRASGSRIGSRTPHPIKLNYQSADYWFWSKANKQYEPVCCAIEKFIMELQYDDDMNLEKLILKIGQNHIEQHNLGLVASKDGLKLGTFKKYFSEVGVEKMKAFLKENGRWEKGLNIRYQPNRLQNIQLTGQVIHWTKDQIYDKLSAQTLDITKTPKTTTKANQAKIVPTAELPGIF